MKPFWILDFGFWIAQAEAARERGFVLPIQNPKSKIQNSRRRCGFTLVEVVLAIALTVTVVYLLTTAMELYLTNVDASRSRVETAQLARTLLDQIANDLASARVAAPAAGRPGGGGFGGQAFSGAGSQSFAAGGPNGQSPGGGGGVPMGGMPQGGPPGGPPGGGPGGIGGAPGGSGFAGAAGPLQGVFGTAEQLRIDRSAYADWERNARELDPQETSSRADMPVTLRYFFVDDNRVSTERLAQQGVARQYSTQTAAGLYRETIPTAAISPDDPPLPTTDVARSGAKVELLAPEVVGFELTYFNGTEVLDEWDPALDGGMPRGVEILLTIAQPRFNARPSQEEQQRLAEGRYLESERVEFRRFVRLPLVAASPPAQMLLPMAGGGPGGGGPGRPGQGAPNQGGPNQGGQSGGGAGGGQPGGGP